MFVVPPTSGPRLRKSSTRTHTQISCLIPRHAPCSVYLSNPGAAPSKATKFLVTHLSGVVAAADGATDADAAARGGGGPAARRGQGLASIGLAAAQPLGRMEAAVWGGGKDGA